MRKLFLLNLVFLLFIISSGCYQRRSGCLDPLATNLDVSADDPCVDRCCVYPSLNLRILKMAGDSTFKINDTLTNNLRQKYRIIDLRMYLSGFTLRKQDGNLINTLEKIATADNSVIASDDIKIWVWAQDAVVPGTIQTSGVFNQLTFYLGLSPQILSNTFTQLPTNHSLIPPNNLKDAQGNTVHATMKLVRYAPKTDTLDISWELSKTPILNTITSSMTMVPGQDLDITIKADYVSLMKDVNLFLSDLQIKNQIFDNFKDFFSVK